MKSYGPRGISWRKLPTFEHGIVISKAISFVRQWSKIFLGRLYEYVNVAFFLTETLIVVCSGHVRSVPYLGNKRAFLLPHPTLNK